MTGPAATRRPATPSSRWWCRARCRPHRRLVRYRITFEDARRAAGDRAVAGRRAAELRLLRLRRRAVLDRLVRARAAPTSTFPADRDGRPAGLPPDRQRRPTSPTASTTAARTACTCSGTLVYDGDVYDHIEFENRGEASTYVSGKNKWRFHFNRARDFEARDNLRQALRVGLEQDELRGLLEPVGRGAPRHGRRRGGGLLPALRTVRRAQPAHPLRALPRGRRRRRDRSRRPSTRATCGGSTSRVEQPGRLVPQRPRPARRQRLQDRGRQRRQEGAGARPAGRFVGLERASTRHSNSTQTEQWWRDNIDLDAYYSFRACNRISGNVDIRDRATTTTSITTPTAAGCRSRGTST